MILSNIKKEKTEWEAKGYELPGYDREKMIERTKQEPVWIHFGAGNIFRAFHANIAEKLLKEGVMESGIIVTEGYDYEIIEKMYRPNAELSILATLKADGTVKKDVIGSVAESCILDSDNQQEFDRLKEIFSKDSLQLATFTITEKGYSLVNGKGEVLPAVEVDYENGPAKPVSYIGKVASLLYTRYQNGAKPIAMVSTDNCSHNGDKLKAAVMAYAKKWVENGFAEEGFTAYLGAESKAVVSQNNGSKNAMAKVTFPWSMIDKITPRPDASVEEILRNDGIEGLDPVITSKNTYVAPFVNAEECEYLVIEDAFPNGRPQLEKAGVLFTARETVDQVERMKVCTCLNPLHTALAVYGCLLGYTKISEEMKDADLRKLVEIIGYKEGLPVVTDPGIINPKEFIDTVLNVRIPNPFMPDTPQRIATDTSQKLAIRYGKTIENYKAAGKDLGELKLIPLVYAGWLRYLMAVDDEGSAFELSSDPMLATVCPYLEKVQLGAALSVEQVEEILRPVLQDQKIWGVDLYELGMEQLVCDYFAQLIAGKGAIRDTLRKYTA